MFAGKQRLSRSVSMTYGIIGAGLSGLSAAQALSERGEAVVLFDKGRGPGGRMSSRRAQTPYGQIRFDHGVSYFGAEDRKFQTWLDTLERASIVAPWAGRFVSIDANAQVTPLNTETRWVGTPRMNAMVRHLSDQHQVHWSVQVTALQPGEQGWMITANEGQEFGPYKRLLVAIPAEQAAILLRDVDDDLAERAARAKSKPCWSVMCAFADPVQVDWDGAVVEDNALQWCSRDRSKPGRESAEAWVLHASRDWSLTHVEGDADEVATALVNSFRAITNAPMPGYMAAHRWRYAQPEICSPASHLWNEDVSLGLCGDWFGGGTVEAAWLSGQSVVQALGE